MKFQKYLTEADDIQRVFLQVERINWDGRTDDLIETEFNASTSNFMMPRHISKYIDKMLGRLVWRKTLGDDGNKGEIKIRILVGGDNDNKKNR